ncbi:MAG: hypothetical protein ABH871_01630, partial [Pseudomonadota bacterium]
MRSGVGSNALDRWSVSGTCQGCSSETQQPPISEMAGGQVSDSERSHLSVGIDGKFSTYCLYIMEYFLSISILKAKTWKNTSCIFHVSMFNNN